MDTPAQIGKYEIIRPLGRSMTEVYLAMDTMACREVALKLIPLADDQRTRLMVEAERRGAAIQKELQHLDPRVVEVYEYGDLEGYFFVAMQFVQGRTVADVLATDRIVEPHRAAIIGLELCEQLAKFHACEAAVVHGDIKPSNVHLGRTDTVRLLDFGIAKMLRVDGTTVHQFGSPGYCSPERLTRAKVDPQSDLWALGATLYEMLAGKPPFQADDTRKLEALIRSGRPPRALPASCPAGLRAVVAKALAPEPGKRYASAAGFQADLQLFLEGKRTTAEAERHQRWNPTATVEAACHALVRLTRTARRRRKGRQAMGAAASFVTGMLLWIGGTLGWQGWQSRASAAAAQARPAPPQQESLAPLYQACADRVLQAYRSARNPGLWEFDWPKAEVCLDRAVQLGATDDATTAKLALARGYSTLERLEGGQYSETAAPLLRTKVRDEFAAAAGKTPADPEPHLALARVYVYQLHDPERAMAEFAAAERLGAVLGAREVEQKGDAYRLRAQREMPREWRRAMRDAEAARAFYRRIPNFDQADVHLRELDQIRPPVRHRVRTRRYYAWR